MPKFRYRMQNILDIKVKLENQAKIEYGLAEQRLAKENEKLQELVVRRMQYEKRLKSLMEGILDIQEMNQMRQAVDSMRFLIRRQMVEVHKAELALEKAQKAYMELRQDRKMHEKLKEKAFEQFKFELAQEEGKEIDQLVSYTFNDK